MLLYAVSWEQYTALLDAFADQRLRHSYDEGTLEMMSPLKDHGWVKKIIARLIEAATLELDIAVQCIGSTTLRGERVRKGLEPDECYYISHEQEVRGRLDFDPDRDPPPDLAVEVDVTHQSLNRMHIYAALGIPELWRSTSKGMVFYRLNRAGRYSEVARSRELPLFTPAVLDEYLALRKSKNDTAIIRQFVTWLRGTQKKKHK